MAAAAASETAAESLGGELAATRATLATQRAREAELEARLVAAAEELKVADGVAGNAESARVAAEHAHAQELAAVLAQVRLVFSCRHASFAGADTARLPILTDTSIISWPHTAVLPAWSSRYRRYRSIRLAEECEPRW